MLDTPFYKAHRPGPDAMTAAWAPEVDTYYKRVHLHQPAGQSSGTMYMPGYGCVPVGPASLPQQIAAAVEQAMDKRFGTAMGNQQPLPAQPAAAQQRAQSAQQQLHPEPLADGTVLALPPGPQVPFSPLPSLPAAAPQQLPRLSAYNTLQQMAEAWLVGQGAATPQGPA